MPNECVNRMTVTCKENDHPILQEIQSIPYITTTQVGKRGIRFNYVSAWEPYNEWLEYILQKYPTCWAKNEWISEDGTAGMWIGTAEKHKEARWIDLSFEDEVYFFG